MSVNLHLGDNLEILKKYPDNYFDSVVTDPPYGIYFLNKKWDYSVPDVSVWKEVFRVLKPGGHILVFCSTRTQHRMAINIEDAGFEIRDVITWVYGQGFPKSYNIPAGIEAKLTIGNTNTTSFKNLDGEERERGLGYSEINYKHKARPNNYNDNEEPYKVNFVFKTDEANMWKGWGTALKPACEFITLARKPISEETIVDNVLKWGTGGINIDESRIELNGEIIPINVLEKWSGFGQKEKPKYSPTENTLGRWPANFILECTCDDIEIEGSIEKSKYLERKRKGFMLSGSEDNVQKAYSPDTYGDGGLKIKHTDKNCPCYILENQKQGVSRFFYVVKPSKKQKNLGLKLNKNTHPTVKPVELLVYLVKLITPKNGVVLDLYMGSGTTGIACKITKNNFVGIEIEKEYYDIAEEAIENFNVFDWA